MRTGRPAIVPSSTRSSPSTSWTISRPRKRRRNSGGTSSPISRGDGRRPSPPATRIVTFATPSRPSSSTVAAIASCARIRRARGNGQVRQLDHDRRRCRRASRATRAAGPRAGSAAPRAWPTPTAFSTSVGGGGRSTTPSSGTSTTAIRRPERSGIRVTGAAVASAAVSPKTLTGEELELDDAPARDADLFLVDGNNLAYRAFFALPEELATSDGVPTGALLGFTNMLFKLLSDYRPKAVAVAWDSRPVHRTRARRGGRRRLQGRPQADAGSAARAVPELPADRRGVRLPEPRVRGLGGRRRDRDARDARRRRGRPHLRRLDRPRRVPALLGERLPDDDAARGRRRAGLHARARRGSLRRPARPGARLHRAQGRHLRQHPRRPRDRRQDRRAS